MSRSARLRIASIILALMLTFGPQAVALKLYAGSRTLIVLPTTNRMPEINLPDTCYCNQTATEKRGTCYYMSSKNGCASRDCAPTYACVSGVKTDIVCIRRKITVKVIMVTPGVCEKKPISGYQYVPYNSSPLSEAGPTSLSPSPLPTHSPTSSPPPSPSLAVIETKNVAGFYLIVANDRVMITSEFLDNAKKYLAGYTTGPRCIFEVKAGIVVVDPHTIAGYPQTAQYGFNKSWEHSGDIGRMHAIAVSYYNRNFATQSPSPIPIATRNIRGKYIVVVNTRAVGRRGRLNDAKALLARFSRGSRCIFEVKSDAVVADPSIIARYPQTAQYGFNKSWRSLDDVKRMHAIAVEYYNSL